MRFLEARATQGAAGRITDGNRILSFEIQLREQDGSWLWITVQLPDKGWGLDKAREAAEAIALLRSNGVVI